MASLVSVSDENSSLPPGAPGVQVRLPITRWTITESNGRALFTSPDGRCLYGIPEDGDGYLVIADCGVVPGPDDTFAPTFEVLPSPVTGRVRYGIGEGECVSHYTDDDNGTFYAWGGQLIESSICGSGAASLQYQEWRVVPPAP